MVFWLNEKTFGVAERRKQCAVVYECTKQAMAQPINTPQDYKKYIFKKKNSSELFNSLIYLQKVTGTSQHSLIEMSQYSLSTRQTSIKMFH